MRPTLPFLILPALLSLAACTETVTTGAGDYRAFCASCHGNDARGHGAGGPAAGLVPSDLTLIAAGNGGSYPRGAVMAKIYGYTQADQHGAAMPAFGPLLEGKTVLYDAGDGVQTPTPWRLVAIAEYIESLQRNAP